MNTFLFAFWALFKWEAEEQTFLNSISLSFWINFYVASAPSVIFLILCKIEGSFYMETIHQILLFLCIVYLNADWILFNLRSVDLNFVLLLLNYLSTTILYKICLFILNKNKRRNLKFSMIIKKTLKVDC